MLEKIRAWFFQTSTVVANLGLATIWAGYVAGDLDLHHAVAAHIPVLVGWFANDGTMQPKQPQP